jgi:hypothetical protein
VNKIAKLSKKLNALQEKKIKAEERLQKAWDVDNDLCNAIHKVNNELDREMKAALEPK